MHEPMTHVTTFANGDTAAGTLYPDGVQTITFLRPDCRTFTTIYVPHGYHGPRLLDVIQTHAPGAPLHTSRTLADDPDAPPELAARWASLLTFDTTRGVTA